MTIALTCPFGTSQTPQVGVCASRNWRAENRFSTEQSENVYENKGTAQKGVSISGLRKTNWFLSFQSAMVPVLISAIFRLRSATP